MATVHAVWQRIPVIIRAIVTGLAMGAAGTVPWAALVAANMKYAPFLPWAVPVMAAYLWLFWRYARGAGWPRTTAAARHANSRANHLPADSWGPALLAGILGLVSILLLQGVLSRLVVLPQQRELDISQYPLATVFLWLTMSAVVAGLVEETSFRGFLQRPIERRHGPVIAILVTGSLFGLAHFTHPEVGLVLLPYYIGASAVYGTLAYLTDSTFPGMALHAGGNMFGAFGLLAQGRSEWQLSSAPPPLIWQTGPDPAFWGNLAGLLVALTLTIWAFHGLAGSARSARAAGTETART
jgi:membrane protease YdiL (CAAX protease family)